MDPVLTYSLPPRQTACGIIDILMHTLDRYFAPEIDNAVTDELAEAIMRIAIQYGNEVMEKPDDYGARSELMWAGSVSHNSLTSLGTTPDFAVHQLGHALSAKYDLPHAESLSIAWPAWARYVYRINVPRFAKYARKVWGIAGEDDEAAAVAGINTTEEFFRSLGAPVRLTEAVGDSAKDDIDHIVQHCTYNGARTIGSFLVLDAQKIRDIYLSAL